MSEQDIAPQDTQVSGTAGQAPAPESRASRLKLFIPLAVFAVLAAIFWSVLNRKDYDPQHLPSALVGQPVPEFSLVTVENDTVVTAADLKGEAYLLNVWATWCITCRVEHPYLNELRKQGVKIVGVDYKDDRAKARQWLQDLGNPYEFSLYDPEGTFGLDLGVSGAPETYIVDKQGIIRDRHMGDLNPRVWQDKVGPLYERLGAE